MSRQQSSEARRTSLSRHTSTTNGEVEVRGDGRKTPFMIRENFPHFVAAWPVENAGVAEGRDNPAEDAENGGKAGDLSADGESETLSGKTDECGDADTPTDEGPETTTDASDSSEKGENERLRSRGAVFG